MEALGGHIDFICIGAQKAGTTWLYKRLQEQSGFLLPPVKEIHYWDKSADYPSPSADKLREVSMWQSIKTQSRLTIRGNQKHAKWYRKWHHGVIGNKWYASLFSKEDYSGDITPSYSMLSVSDIRMMYEVSPNAKIIFLLRNPIDRAWSHYRHKLRIDGSQQISPLDFITSESQTLRSDYQSTIARYSQVYPRGQIMLAFYDAISDQPQRLLTDIVAFINDGDTTTISPVNLSHKAHVGTPLTMPAHIKSSLTTRYTDLITDLAIQYGSYAKVWKDNSDNVATDVLEDCQPTIIL